MSEQQFEINRIYVKDVSTEAPNTPAVFQMAWEPEIDLNLANEVTELEKGIFEVSLILTVTATLEDKTAYVIEVDQAGIFTVLNFEEEQQGFIIGAMIPNILFPYARETISTLSQKAGFPPMVLNPIDFNGLYQQHLQNQAGESVESAETKH